MTQEHNYLKLDNVRNCTNCARPRIPSGVCPLSKTDIDTCLQNPSRPFWKPSAESQAEVGHNNGGSTDYYKFHPAWTDCQDVIEARSMNFSQGNIFKVAFCFNVGRHSAVTYERELNKIIWFAQRELDRLQKELAEKEID